MFTGIVEEVGRVVSREEIAGGIRLGIEAQTVFSDLSVGDSIAVNGVCLTVVKRDAPVFAVEAVGETLEKTNMGQLAVEDQVNLERALAAGDRLGGHFVQGHVNGVGNITQWYPRGENFFLEVSVPPTLLRYIIPEGSIAIDGISLTVAHLEEDRVGINIIPHTAKVTNLQYRKVGDTVNIEVDMIAKYVERLLGGRL